MSLALHFVRRPSDCSPPPPPPPPSSPISWAYVFTTTTTSRTSMGDPFGNLLLFTLWVKSCCNLATAPAINLIMNIHRYIVPYECSFYRIMDYNRSALECVASYARLWRHTEDPQTGVAASATSSFPGFPAIFMTWVNTNPPLLTETGVFYWLKMTQAQGDKGLTLWGRLIRLSSL